MRMRDEGEHRSAGPPPAQPAATPPQAPQRASGKLTCAPLHLCYPVIVWGPNFIVWPLRPSFSIPTSPSVPRLRRDPRTVQKLPLSVSTGKVLVNATGPTRPLDVTAVAGNFATAYFSVPFKRSVLVRTELDTAGVWDKIPG